MRFVGDINFDASDDNQINSIKTQMKSVAKERCKVLIANFQIVSTINQVSRFHIGHFQLCAEMK